MYSIQNDPNVGEQQVWMEWAEAQTDAEAEAANEYRVYTPNNEPGHESTIQIEALYLNWIPS